MNDDQPRGAYISINEAADILHIGIRQVYNHMNANRIGTRKVGRRRLLSADDVYRLADELDVSGRELQRSADSGQTGPQLAIPEQIMAQLATLSKHTGELEEQLRNRPTAEDAAKLREQLAAAEARAKAFEEQLAYYRRPWWRRLLGV
jgi:excisionase family DNA binding protein